jgi:hypothetical protein
MEAMRFSATYTAQNSTYKHTENLASFVEDFPAFSLLKALVSGTVLGARFIPAVQSA